MKIAFCIFVFILVLYAALTGNFFLYLFIVAFVFIFGSALYIYHKRMAKNDVSYKSDAMPTPVMPLQTNSTENNHKFMHSNKDAPTSTSETQTHNHNVGTFDVVVNFTNNKHLPKVLRDHKGMPLLNPGDEFIIFDIETTGLSPAHDEIIEIGALHIKNNNIVDKFEALIKPRHGVDSFIEQLTGINDGLLENEKPISHVLPLFLSFVGDNIVVGHNVHFDINFIYDNCVKLSLPPFKNNFVDTMQLSKLLYKQDSYKLSILAQRFNIDCPNHRAINDCICTYELYKIIYNHLLNEQIDISKLHVESRKKIKTKDIASSVTVFDITHPMYDREFVFTGTLTDMLRHDAMQIVVNKGGSVGDNITRKTNYLVMGSTDYDKVKDGKSSKLKKAEEYKLNGVDISIIPENVFTDMLAM